MHNKEMAKARVLTFLFNPPPLSFIYATQSQKKSNHIWSVFRCNSILISMRDQRSAWKQNERISSKRSNPICCSAKSILGEFVHTKQTSSRLSREQPRGIRKRRHRGGEMPIKFLDEKLAALKARRRSMMMADKYFCDPWCFLEFLLCAPLVSLGPKCHRVSSRHHHHHQPVIISEKFLFILPVRLVRLDCERKVKNRTRELGRLSLGASWFLT